MNVGAKLAGGRASLEAGELQQAFAAVSEVLRVQPKNPDGCYLVGLILMRAGNLEAALPNLKWAAEMRPKDAAAQTDFAELNLRMGKAPAAVHHFRLAVKAD